MSRKYDTPWINEESKIALVKKRKLWKKYRYNKNQQNKTKYEEARTEANRLVRKAKYECSLVCFLHILFLIHLQIFATDY
jgi:hypothetical protein